LIVIFGLWLFVFQVRTTEVAVVTTFGKADAPPHRSGATSNGHGPIQRSGRSTSGVQNFEDKLTEA